MVGACVDAGRCKPIGCLADWVRTLGSRVGWVRLTVGQDAPTVWESLRDVGFHGSMLQAGRPEAPTPGHAGQSVGADRSSRMDPGG
jgi:hypothetical protein